MVKTVAESLQHNPELLAGLVAAYQQRHRLDDQALMRRLEMNEFGLARLVLLKRPPADAAATALQSLAEAVGCSEAGLRAILAEGASATGS